MKKMKEYGAKIGNDVYPFILNDEIYKNAGIAEACGFVRPGTQDIDAKPGADAQSLKRSFAVVKINVSGSTTNGTKKRWSLWCVTNNLANARVQLLTKNIGEFEIDKVSARRTTRYR
jgi:hypothetical protein